MTSCGRWSSHCRRTPAVFRTWLGRVLRIFAVAGGLTAELLEPGEAAFDDVAACVDVGVEGRWSATGRAFGLAGSDLVAAFGAGEGDVPAAQRRSGGGVGVGLVGHHPVRALPRPAGPDTGDGD